jgi:hypothetical protein
MPRHVPPAAWAWAISATIASSASGAVFTIRAPAGNGRAMPRAPAIRIEAHRALRDAIAPAQRDQIGAPGPAPIKWTVIVLPVASAHGHAIGEIQRGASRRAPRPAPASAAASARLPVPRARRLAGTAGGQPASAGAAMASSGRPSVRASGASAGALSPPWPDA